MRGGDDVEPHLRSEESSGDGEVDSESPSTFCHIFLLNKGAFLIENNRILSSSRSGEYRLMVSLRP